MNKPKILSLLMTAAVVPTIGLAVASPASADGYIEWKNKDTGKCLSYERDDLRISLAKCGSRATKWFDNQLSDKNWNEGAVYRGSQCLDSNKWGSVYLTPCEPGNNYQSWSEEKWDGGWVLKNVATGRCLNSTYESSIVMTGICSPKNIGMFWE